MSAQYLNVKSTFKGSDIRLEDYTDLYWSTGICMCVYVCRYVCMYLCMYVCVIYVCVHVRMYICMYMYGTPHKKVYNSYRSKYAYLRSSSYVPYFTLTPYVRTCWSTRSTRIPA